MAALRVGTLARQREVRVVSYEVRNGASLRHREELGEPPRSRIQARFSVMEQWFSDSH